MLQGIVLVKRSFIAEQLESYRYEVAAIAAAQKQVDDCKVVADQMFTAQLALQTTWKELHTRVQSLQKEKAEYLKNNAFLQEQVLKKKRQQVGLPACETSAKQVLLWTFSSIQ